ncbi:RNA polymerase-binding transcription factor DksA [bacterium BMS3Abin04]|nr:RNA polymerase-binding transcription factor DksA [bacterium BMS3Abin04]
MAKKIEKKKTEAKAKKPTKTVVKKAIKDKKLTAKKSASVKKVTTAKKAVPKSKTEKKSTAVKAPRKRSSVREVEVISPTKKIKRIKGYGKTDLKMFKKVILEKRSEILDQLQNLRDQMMDPTTGQYVNENSPYSLHMAEQGTDAQEREKLYLWAQRETKFLGYLEDALQRIEKSTYGICIDCIDEPQNLCPTCPLVPKERLLAVPHTQHCVQVKQRMKKR